MPIGANLFNRILLKYFKKKYFLYTHDLYRNHRLSFSQEGEDLLLARIFEGKELNQFYVDVGAHDPQRFSNTYYFYLQGWRGINIDPLPGSMDRFNDIRPDDINLECAISDNEEKLTYYLFNDPALNTFSREVAYKKDGLHDFRMVGKKNIDVYRLDNILDKYLQDNQKIDFLNIDVEGLDLQVLQSNDWSKYRPEVVLAEDLSRLPIGQALDSPISKYMEKQNYELYAKSVNTLIFKRNN